MTFQAPSESPTQGDRVELPNPRRGILLVKCTTETPRLLSRAAVTSRTAPKCLRNSYCTPGWTYGGGQVEITAILHEARRRVGPSRLGPPVARAAALLLAGAAALVCGGSSALSAQQVQLRPQAGLYAPTRISLQNGVLHVQQKVGLRVGARMTLIFSERFDVTTRVTYIPGYAMLTGAGKQIEVGTASHLLTATTGARYWLLRPGRMLSWEVHTGIGVVSGAQGADESLLEISTVTGSIGTTVRYQIGRIVSFQLRVQDRLYRVRFGGRDPGRSRSPLQVSFGVGLPFLESARWISSGPTSP
jgi:hypothetical protein